jgi:hypothetical protein
MLAVESVRETGPRVLERRHKAENRSCVFGISAIHGGQICRPEGIAWMHACGGIRT